MARRNNIKLSKLPKFCINQSNINIILAFFVFVEIQRKIIDYEVITAYDKSGNRNDPNNEKHVRAELLNNPVIFKDTKMINANLVIT